MSCPFGYTSKGAQGSEASDEEVKEQHNTNKVVKEVKANDASNDKPKASDGDRFNFDKDPVSWFYKNQIQAEEQFQAKRKNKRKEQKARLEDIMSMKNKHLQFEADLDEFSIASSELSELDSDVHSLSSLRSCAESWIEDANYKAPAEAWVKSAPPLALAVAAFSIYQSYTVMQLCSLISTNITNPHWASASLGMAILMVITVGLLYLSARNRSKFLLLCSQAGCLLIYTASAAISAFMFSSPTALDTKGQQDICHAKHKTDTSSPTCTMASALQEQLSAALPLLLWSCMAVGLTALVLAALGIWYTFELAYIEKKAAKHTKRHRHNKHNIPWHKIKVIGPVSTCGQGAAASRGRATGGKCPVMH